MTVGGSLLALSTLVDPGAPFILAAVLAGLALPAIVCTHREAGTNGVRALLRDCVRLPDSWWWLPVAAFGLPVGAWVIAAALGGQEQLTWSLLAYYTADLIIGALVINVWEEMAWTGYLQRRAMARWGVTAGSVFTAAFFTGIHVPLAIDGAQSAKQVATNILFLAGVAIGLRVLVAHVDTWSGRSLLTIGVLHSSFNATESVLDPSHDWVRTFLTIAAAVGIVAAARPGLLRVGRGLDEPSGLRERR